MCPSTRGWILAIDFSVLAKGNAAQGRPAGLCKASPSLQLYQPEQDSSVTECTMYCGYSQPELAMRGNIEVHLPTLYCVEHTDSTATGMRLNSSKQPQAPVWARPL